MRSRPCIRVGGAANATWEQRARCGARALLGLGGPEGASAGPRRPNRPRAGAFLAALRQNLAPEVAKIAPEATSDAHLRCMRLTRGVKSWIFVAK